MGFLVTLSLIYEHGETIYYFVGEWSVWFSYRSRAISPWSQERHYASHLHRHRSSLASPVTSPTVPYGTHTAYCHPLSRESCWRNSQCSHGCVHDCCEMPTEYNVSHSYSRCHLKTPFFYTLHPQTLNHSVTFLNEMFLT